MNNAFSAYKKQSVTTLTPGDVVVKLYMEAERQLIHERKQCLCICLFHYIGFLSGGG